MSSLPIQTKDNSERHLAETEVCHLETLKKLAEPSITDLCQKEHPNLLIFPQDLDAYGDKIGDAHIFEIKGETIVTGNIMGFIGCGDTKVSITSRFAQDRDDYFLHYMLRKVFAVNLFDLQFNSDEESIFDFLIYLFPTFLKRAMQQGMYREYQTRKYNDANVKGRIDISRHIRQNIPFAGKIAYTTREYAQDNHLTQLIRHTIEYISRHRYSGDILRNDDDTTDAVKAICQVTSSYNRNERQKVINENLRPISHPYYNEYRPLQQLCMQILRQEELKYGRDNDEIYGVLFDGAWLWEEYLNTFLADIGFEHPRNKQGFGHKSLFTDGSGRCYPDFLSPDMVLDAKYKWYDDWSKVQAKDLYQVISYMHVLDRENGGYIVPIDWTSPKLPSKKLNGKGGDMSIYGMDVCFNADSFEDYFSNMVHSEQKILNKLVTYKD
jgi:5-methylcytosine-specific restriction endonuclease McrBC regulatory subunit McrC